MSSIFYLELIKLFVEDLKKSNSGNYKKEVLKAWFDSNEFKETNSLSGCNDIQNLLHFVYDYDKQYYVTSANILKHYNDPIDFGRYEKNSTYTLWNLLNDLSTRKYKGNEAIYTCIAFINKNSTYKDIILNIIDKDLQVGVSETTINKIIPNFIKTFDVCLANKYSDKKHKLDANWVIERKLDGCRCILIYKNKNDIKCYSRQGKEFTTLQKIIDEIKGKLPDNTVLDGEICLVDENGNEDFQGIMKVIKRKDYTIDNPMYKVFDLLSLEEFENKSVISRNYLARLASLSDFFYNNPNMSTISKIDFDVYSPKILSEWEQKVAENNWEGLMFRKNVPYEAKRTDNLLKYKKFSDAEYEVIDIEVGDSQEVVNGVVHKIKCVGSLVINHKGNRVGVGTGLSLDQRKKWFDNPEEIIGKTITVKYFEETVDQDGKLSLRFPVLKTVWSDKRDL